LIEGSLLHERYIRTSRWKRAGKANSGEDKSDCPLRTRGYNNQQPGAAGESAISASQNPNRTGYNSEYREYSGPYSE